MINMTIKEVIEQIHWYFNEDNGISAEDKTKDAVTLAVRALEIFDDFDYYFKKELEDIKEEIQKESYELFDCPNAFVVEFADVERIIAKAISPQTPRC